MDLIGILSRLCLVEFVMFTGRKDVIKGPLDSDNRFTFAPSTWGADYSAPSNCVRSPPFADSQFVIGKFVLFGLSSVYPHLCQQAHMPLVDYYCMCVCFVCMYVYVYVCVCVCSSRSPGGRQPWWW